MWLCHPQDVALEAYKVGGHVFFHYGFRERPRKSLQEEGPDRTLCDAAKMPPRCWRCQSCSASESCTQGGEPAQEMCVVGHKARRVEPSKTLKAEVPDTTYGTTGWVSLLVLSSISSLCPHSFLFEWQCISCAIVCYKDAICFFSIWGRVIMKSLPCVSEKALDF